MPGSLESWGVAAGLGSLSVLMCIFFIGLGGIVMSLMVSTFEFRWLMTIRPQRFLWVMLGTYVLLVLSLGVNYQDFCTDVPSSSYCSLNAVQS
jgi:hypothetical protein